MFWCPSALLQSSSQFPILWFHCTLPFNLSSLIGSLWLDSTGLAAEPRNLPRCKQPLFWLRTMDAHTWTLLSIRVLLARPQHPCLCFLEKKWNGKKSMLWLNKLITINRISLPVICQYLWFDEKLSEGCGYGTRKWKLLREASVLI